MIGACRAAGFAKGFGELFRRGAGGSIDDAGPFAGGDEGGQLARQAFAGVDGVADIGPVEARDDEAFARDAELDEDIVAGVVVGCGGERQAGDFWELVEQGAEQAVVWAEVVSPFRDAVRFV